MNLNTRIMRAGRISFCLLFLLCAIFLATVPVLALDASYSSQYGITVCSDWTADVSGDVATTAMAASSGRLEGCYYVPNAGNVADATVDIYVYSTDDANKRDLMGNQLVNLPQTTLDPNSDATEKTPSYGGAFVHPYVYQRLFYVVDEAGASNAGTICCTIIR